MAANNAVKFTTEDADYKRVMAAYGPELGYCKGHRLLVPGYICPHCGSGDPRTRCGSPVPTTT
jgi:hypothetical protein